MSVLVDRITASHSSLVGPQCGAGEREWTQWRVERMSVCLSALNEDQKDNKPGPARVPSSAWTIRPSVKGLSLQPTSLFHPKWRIVSSVEIICCASLDPILPISESLETPDVWGSDLHRWENLFAIYRMDVNSFSSGHGKCTAILGFLLVPGCGLATDRDCHSVSKYRSSKNHAAHSTDHVKLQDNA